MSFARIVLPGLLSLWCSVSIACSSSNAGSSGTCGDISGGYAFDESFSGSCPSTTPITNSVGVTVNGSAVVLNGGINYQVHCTLSGCDCTTASGDVFKFTNSGFTETQTSSGCTINSSGTRK
jgi:hypothetical protein